MSYSSAHITEALAQIRSTIPETVTLVCVSKYQPLEAIEAAYGAGERHFGESRVQELKQKAAALPADIHWHFIGHLQTNKVRDLLKLRPYLIHSVDSIRLLEAINDEAAKLGVIQDILLEVHVAREETKSGFTPEELSAVSCQKSETSCQPYPNVRIRGLMTMATNTDDEAEIRRCFLLTAGLANGLTCKSGISDTGGIILSMGMSDDYRIAIECGATMVRIGSSIFGERDYRKPEVSVPQVPTIRAVFFDQDGVLFDSMPIHARSWEIAMKENGLPFTAEQTYRNEGRTGASVIDEAHRLVYGTPAPQELIEKIYTAKSDYFNQFTGGKLPSLIPGIREVLSFLHAKGVQCRVVTGSGQRSLLDNLNTTFPGIFSGFVTAFDVKHGKPDPEPYLKAWQDSGFSKSECAVVENAPLGVRAGKAAGLFTIAVNTGPLPDSALLEEGADKVFPNMTGLLEWLQNQID